MLIRMIMSILYVIHMTYKVDAQLGGSWRDNWVKLLLNTDQTVLNEVIQQCNSILKKII